MLVIDWSGIVECCHWNTADWEWWWFRTDSLADSSIRERQGAARCINCPACLPGLLRHGLKQRHPFHTSPGQREGSDWIGRASEEERQGQGHGGKRLGINNGLYLTALDLYPVMDWKGSWEEGSSKGTVARWCVILVGRI